MVTNVSTPIFCCDICRARFGEDRARAELCESAGRPDVIPNGSLLLTYDRNSYESRGFRLEKLYIFPNQIGTLATSYPPRAGHTVSYAKGVDPAQHWDSGRRIYRWPDGRQPYPITSDTLVPHQPGVVQMMTDSRMGWHAGVNDLADPDWILDAFKLPRGTLNPGRDFDRSWVRPLTPEVKAVLDALHCYPRFISADPRLRKLKDGWLTNARLATLALGTVARTRPGGSGNIRRARWFLLGADEQQQVARLNAMWREWRGGTDKLTDTVPFTWDTCEPGDYDVPRPHLESTHDHLTASKLSKDLKKLVAATGVEWPPRTNASAYCQMLVSKTLGYQMQADHGLFPLVRVIAVRGRKGGVGKSTVAAALARRLAANGRRVVLVDFDLAGPSQHLLHRLGGMETNNETVKVLPAATDQPGLDVFSPGQVFAPAETPAWSDTTIGQWVDFIGSSLELGEADTVVLDMPPGDTVVHSLLTGDHARADVDVHVTTGHPLALADTERDLGGYAPPGTRYLVENLSRARGLTAGGDTVDVRLQGRDGGAEALAGRTHCTWAGSLPWSAGINALAASDEIGQLASMLTSEVAHV